MSKIPAIFTYYKNFYPTWFLGSVITPFSLQSTEAGRSEATSRLAAEQIQVMMIMVCLMFMMKNVMTTMTMVEVVIC